MGAVFGGISLLLCGDVAPLSLDDTEEREIGAALAACLQTLPTPIGETVGMLGPWSKLASTLGGAILKRMALVAAARRATKAAAAPAVGPRAAAATVPTAPAPAETVYPNGQTVRPPNPYDVVAPAPQQY